MIAKLAFCAAVLGFMPLSPKTGPFDHAAVRDAVVGLVSQHTLLVARQPKSDLLPVERNVLDRTNAERARYGLAPLEVCEELMKSARDHGQWMARNGSLQHTSAPVAENIAMGQQDSRQALASWMGLSGHRANILNASHRRIGVAAYQSGDGPIFWCQQFGP